MAKKGSGSSKIDIVHLSAYIALVFAALIFLVNLILQAVNDNSSIMRNVMRAMTIARDISMLIALGFGGWSFARNRSIVIKVFYAIALVVFLVCAILLNVGIFK